MFLGDLQCLLNDLYDLESAYDIYDFLITDAELAEALDAGGRPSDEKLLIAEDNGDAEVSLYLAAELVERLNRNDPTAGLNEQNLADFWTAFEGVSHFTYFTWKASRDRPVTLLEMELQAEVDKFVVTALLLGQQGERPPQGLHHCLFTLPNFDSELEPTERQRYQRANYYAGKFCSKLWPRLATGFAGRGLQQELRYFYRLTRPAKIGHIEAS